MAQNKKKLIQILIGNLANAVVHEILEKSIDKEELTSKYRKELITSFEIAKKYREKINLINMPLNEKTIIEIREKVHTRVKSELIIRVSKGYTGIQIELIDEIIDKMLRGLNII